MTTPTKLTGLSFFQARELAALAEHDPLLGLKVGKTTATVPHRQETLDSILGLISRTADRGRKNALHSVKRKLQAVSA